jgi:hypothetical protein
VFPQFIVSKIVIDDNGHVNKIPCNPQGITSDHKNPANWLTLEQVTEAVTRLGSSYRVGYSITRETKLFFIDIDKALVNGTWSPLSTDLCNAFPGCYVEVSYSGTGLHIMGRYKGELVHKNKNSALGIELYTHDRFVMFGGHHPRGDWNQDATLSINMIVSQYFDKDSSVVTKPAPIEELDVLTDEEVIARCRNNSKPRKVFGGGAGFDDLYEAREDVLINAYPTQSEGKLYNASGADMAIANMLAAHTKNEDQIIRIMRGSKLVRDKWDNNRTYLSDTVIRAISDRKAIQTTPNQFTKSGSLSQTIDGEMPKEFDGCFYVVSEREIYTTSYGLVNQEGFNVCYGGPYLKEQPYKTFKGHAKGSGRIVGRLGFRPDLPHGAITEREGITAINMYKPLNIKMREGDMTPFWRFFKAMIPNKIDQYILMSYVCTLVQKPGVKSQWCPVLQGVQGCGKSLFADFIAYACGETYTHRAKGDEFENKFNAQWFGKTLILVEDVDLKEKKLEVVLKPLITSKLLAFEGKGKNVQMNDFPANFILTLNDFDLLQKKADSRRLAVFMSALQTPEDLINAGLTPAEYRRIVDWRDNGGYEIVAHYLHNTPPHPDYDFSKNCVTAPKTSTTDEAIEASRPNIELMILEEIELGRVGFRGGWISSTALNDFIFAQRVRHLMPDNRRGGILKDLGYIRHPGLRDGQAVREVMPDNKRSRLYVRHDHPSLELDDRELIVRAYEEAQK